MFDNKDEKAQDCAADNADFVAIEDADSVLTEYSSYPEALFGGAEVFVLEDEDTGDPLRVLYVGGGFQSATYIDDRKFDLVFEYYRAFNVLFDALAQTQGRAADGTFAGGALTTALEDAASDIAVDGVLCGGITLPDVLHNAEGAAPIRVLMMGAGGCSYPKYLIANYPTICVDAVEIDPVVLDIARTHFYVDEAIERFDAQDRLRLIAEDGRDFLARTQQAYDAILNDCFGGQDLVRKLASVEAAQAVKARLNPGGVYLANVVSKDDGADVSAIQNVATTLAQVFEHVSVVPCFDEDYAGEDNYLVLATDGAFTPENALDPVLSLSGMVISDE